MALKSFTIVCACICSLAGVVFSVALPSWLLGPFDLFLNVGPADAVQLEVLRLAALLVLAVALAGAMSLPSVREFLRRRAARLPVPAFRVDGDFARAVC